MTLGLSPYIPDDERPIYSTILKNVLTSRFFLEPTASKADGLFGRLKNPAMLTSMVTTASRYGHKVLALEFTSGPKKWAQEYLPRLEEVLSTHDNFTHGHWAIAKSETLGMPHRQSRYYVLLWHESCSQLFTAPDLQAFNKATRWRKDSNSRQIVGTTRLGGLVEWGNWGRLVDQWGSGGGSDSQALMDTLHQWVNIHGPMPHPTGWPQTPATARQIADRPEIGDTISPYWIAWLYGLPAPDAVPIRRLLLRKPEHQPMPYMAAWGWATCNPHPDNPLRTYAQTKLF